MRISMRRVWMLSILVILVATLLIWILIELYLFKKILLNSTLTRDYFRMLPALIVLGITDYLATYFVTTQAARGRAIISLSLATIVAYTSLVLSKSILATFFLPMHQHLNFFIGFFLNRLWNVSKSIIYGEFTLGSVAYGTKISALALAFPAAVVSCFFLWSAVMLAVLSNKYVQLIVHYFAERVLRPDEKNIYQKLSILLMSFLSVVFGFAIYVVTLH